MYTVRPPLLAKPWFREAQWRVETTRKVLYLTFDDGPVPGVTDKALDVLDGYNAKATFFCLGKQVEAHPALYQQLLERGHAVGNHTWDHPSGWQTPNDRYFENIEQAATLITSTLFRPPYGRIQRSPSMLWSKSPLSTSHITTVYSFASAFNCERCMRP